MYGDFCMRYEKDQMDICRMIHDYAEKAYIEGCNEGLRQGYFENSNEYNKGPEDTWEWVRHIDEGCDTCKYEDIKMFSEPCVHCMRNYLDKWEAKR